MDVEEGSSRKRKRSASPQTRSPSPEKKVGRIETLLNFFSPGPKQPGAGERTPAKSSAKKSEKKRISFGTPKVHSFDAFSPSRRKRPEAADCFLDAEKQDIESLRVELECRKEEEELVNIDLDKSDRKTMVKLVNQLWTKDQIARLKAKGLCGPKDAKLPRKLLATKVALMEAIERKSDVLMSGEHLVLPDQMDDAMLNKELKKRRIGIEGDRLTRERRLEDALLKEGSRFDVQGEDGYAFGRHAVSARNVIEELSNQELRHQLLLPHWGLDKKSIPRKRNEREDLLEKLVNDELGLRRDIAFGLALDNMLLSHELSVEGPKIERFQRLCQESVKTGKDLAREVF
mmetsp:Transcript_8096/g.20115  ORF Transcript_8096/g.20115 Transcript_8096/m.20115 type:complete len:345 (+) Transcript_8096:106-1140(+)